ncbi:hypothetical protein CIB48_g8522 [Xylaria polymorpha]|nr:hypothetical protein CIB48_g8522 [Xylaria polymorpha]
MTGSSSPANSESNEQDSGERRWPLKRGGYAIEKQCSVCRYWFDSFDPERRRCHVCLDSKEDTPPPPVNTSIPNPAVQQSEVPQALLNPLPLFDVPAVENTQLDNTQYQQYGQGCIASPDLPFSTGMMSSLSGGYNMPNQMWGQGYDMSLNSSEFAGVMSDPMGGYTQNQMYGGGYLMSPDLSFPSGTMSNPLGMYTPDQQWGQEFNMPLDPSNSFGTLQCTTGGYMQNQAYQQGNGSSFDNFPQNSYEGIQPKMAQPTVPKPKPLRPLLPRDKNAPPPPEVENDDDGDDDNDNDDNDEAQEGGAYRTWLKSQAVYRHTIKKHGSSSKNKASGSKKKQSSKSHKQKK